jgi:hypothetical protein
MPDGKSALSNLNRPRVINEEAERGLLGPDPETESEIVVGSTAPTLVAAPRRRAGKQSSFESLAASVAPEDEPVPFSVRLPRWLRAAVVERIKMEQAKGKKLTQDMVAKQALMSFFDLDEPK